MRLLVIFTFILIGYIYEIKFMIRNCGFSNVVVHGVGPKQKDFVKVVQLAKIFKAKVKDWLSCVSA